MEGGDWSNLTKIWHYVGIKAEACGAFLVGVGSEGGAWAEDEGVDVTALELWMGVLRDDESLSSIWSPSLESSMSELNLEAIGVCILWV